MLRFLGKWFALSIVSGLLLGRFMKASKGSPIPDDGQRDLTGRLRRSSVSEG